LSTPRITYPRPLGYWPAFSFYVILIWIELFVLPKPFVLSVVLLVYSLITFTGVVLIGKDAWFHRCDFFSVFFRLIATLAPVEYGQARDEKPQGIRLRLPFVGAGHDRPEH